VVEDSSEGRGSVILMPLFETVAGGRAGMWSALTAAGLASGCWISCRRAEGDPCSG